MVGTDKCLQSEHRCGINITESYERRENMDEAQTPKVVTYTTESDPVEGLRAAWESIEKLVFEGGAQEGVPVVLEVIPLGNINGPIQYTIKASQ